MTNIYGSTGFYWWVGVVEDRQDPLFLGRCKVRILGYHTGNTTILPTQDLPWAYPLQPITSAAVSGIGQTPLGPVEGTWVTGYFRDGDNCQEPIMIGTMAGMPSFNEVNELRNRSGQGFQDNSKNYPKDSYLQNNESDVNRLARNQHLSDTIVNIKDDARVTGVKTAFDATWDQPKIPYNSVYPYNHVYESESGHVIEIDDTEENERLSIYHRAGTYLEVDRNGSKTTRVVGDNCEIYLRHNNILVKGNANVTIEGTCNIFVKNDCNLEVNGDLKMHAHGNLELKSGKAITLAAKLGLNLHSSLSNGIKFSGLGTLSGIAPVATITNPLGPSVIDPVTTTPPEFSDLTLPDRRPEA